MYLTIILDLPSGPLPCLSSRMWRCLLLHKSSDFSEELSAFNNNVEDGGNKFLWRRGKSLHDQLASHPVLIRLHNHYRGNLRYRVLLSGFPPKLYAQLLVSLVHYMPHLPHSPLDRLVRMLNAYANKLEICTLSAPCTDLSNRLTV
jgi:hypothetical protein